jgi:hypothetical protein
VDRYDWALIAFVVLDLGLAAGGLALLAGRQKLGAPFYGVAALVLVVWTAVSLIASGQMIVTATTKAAALTFVLSRVAFVCLLPLARRVRKREAPFAGDRL